MLREQTYPGLYMAEDSDTHTVVPGLCARGFYVILLCGRTPENETLFGRRYYDYSDASLSCCAPGLPRTPIHLNASLHCRWIVAFRPELFEEAPSEKEISGYTFFTYYPREALHLSVAELRVLVSCMNDIRIELQRPRDHYSNSILAKHIHRILDYITRFYERQFITREIVVEKIIDRYDKLLEGYMKTGRLRTDGMPSAKYCADRLFLSESCFGDLLRHKTGRTHDCYCQIKRIEIAGRKLTGTNVPLRQLVTDLGFPSVQYFCFLFKKITGCAPGNYRVCNGPTTKQPV